MSHNPNSNADTSGFNYPSAAGVPTNLDQNNVGIVPTANSSTTESSSSVRTTTTYPTSNNRAGPTSDPNYGKLGGEHGGSGTRTDDRKGDNVENEANTASPISKHHEP
jgi:hypothetical protein